MTPYADFLYFGVLLYIAIPTLLQGLIARLRRVWILVATAVMLVVQYWAPQSWAPWGTVRELWVVLGYACVEYLVGAGFLTLRRDKSGRWAFYGAVSLALAPLLIAKFVPVFAPHTTIGFLGISYVTFRSLDVIFSIQDRVVTALPAMQYLAYLLFFPAISSGPVDRYRRFALDWTRDRTRAEFLDDLDSAVHHVFRGFLYKFILAALIKQHWLDPVAHADGFLNVASYMYAYSFYLFFDFAGYSAFAVGISHLFGIHTPENFNLPFLARNIRDFWNRWHMSLSFWFRDHVYTRFVFAATKGHWFKNRYVASYIGFSLSMGLMGLWHGTASRYLIYGLYHGALLVLYDMFTRWNKQHALLDRGWPSHVVSIVGTFHLVCFGLLIFSGRLG